MQPTHQPDIFEPEPTHESDVRPMLDLIREVDPDIVGVALDPEASGPSTHYRVLQVLIVLLSDFGVGFFFFFFFFLSGPRIQRTAV